MKFFKKLKEVNQKLGKVNRKEKEISEKTEDFKKSVDSNKRTDEENKNIKKCKLWCLLNLFLILAMGVGVFFLIKMITDLFVIGSLIGIGVIMAVVGTSVKKAMTFTEDEAPGLGVRLWAKVNFGLMIIALIAAVFLNIIL